MITAGSVNDYNLPNNRVERYALNIAVGDGLPNLN